MKNLQPIATQSVYWLKVISLGLILGLGIQFAQAWTNPGGSPPTGNVAGPITTGVNSQVKNGSLGLAGNLVVGLKASSASTVAGDIGTTLVTKDYVDSNAGGGGIVKYGGSFVIGGGVNNAGYVAPCYEKNIVTNTCSCPAGYTQRLAGYGAYYWWHSWDNYNWSYVCESL